MTTRNNDNTAVSTLITYATQASDEGMAEVGQNGLQLSIPVGDDSADSIVDLQTFVLKAATRLLGPVLISAPTSPSEI